MHSNIKKLSVFLQGSHTSDKNETICEQNKEQAGETFSVVPASSLISATKPIHCYVLIPLPGICPAWKLIRAHLKKEERENTACINQIKVLTTPRQCSFQEQAQYALMPLLWKKSIWNACHFANIWRVMSSWGLVPRRENSFAGKAKYFKWRLSVW